MLMDLWCPSCLLIRGCRNQEGCVSPDSSSALIHHANKKTFAFEFCLPPVSNALLCCCILHSILGVHSNQHCDLGEEASRKKHLKPPTATFTGFHDNYAAVKNSLRNGTCNKGGGAMSASPLCPQNRLCGCYANTNTIFLPLAPAATPSQMSAARCFPFSYICSCD